MKISTLILHYNNPSSLNNTILNIVKNGFDPLAITVFDNCSDKMHAQRGREIAVRLGCQWEESLINRGWGAAINFYLNSKSWKSDDILMISAHDAIINEVNIEKIKSSFRDRNVVFISPQYPDPLVCTYSTSRSFKAFSGSAPTDGVVVIGHATLCLARVNFLINHPFDEEFFIYGCESEIYLRAHDKGFTTLLPNDFIVSNPTTDTSNEFRDLAFTINSFYLAKKRGGYFSFLLRLFVVTISIIKLITYGKLAEAKIKARSLLYSLMNPGLGFAGFIKKNKI